MVNLERRAVARALKRGAAVVSFGLTRCAALVFAAATFMVMTACGGGGGGASSTAVSTGVTAEGGTTTVSARIDVDVPAPAAAKVQQIKSAAGSVPLGAPLAVPPLLPGAQSYVFATDAEGGILLATVVSAGDTRPVLSVASTALALVNLVQGTPPAGMSQASFNEAIQAAAEFRNLTALVAQAAATGVAPIDVIGFADSLLKTLNEVNAARARKASREIPTTKASVGSRVKPPLPFTVLATGIGDLMTVRVVASDAAVDGVALVNGFNITFAASGSRIDDDKTVFRPIDTGLDGTLQRRLPAAGLIDFSALPTTSVSGNGSAWNLRIFRTVDTRTQDWSDFADDFAKAVFGEINPCVGLEMRAPDAGKVIATWISEGRDAAFDGIIAGLGDPGTWLSLAEDIRECAQTIPSLTKVTAQAKDFATLLSKDDTLYGFFIEFASTRAKFLLKFAKTLGLVYDLSSLGTKLALMYKFADADYRIRVCQHRDPASGALDVVACLAMLQISPSPLVLNAGAQVRLVVKAFDDAGAQTTVPAGLTFTSSDAAIASVDSSGLVTANAGATGTAVITVTDPASGLSGTVTVAPSTSRWQLLPVDATLTPGASVTFVPYFDGAAVASGVQWSATGGTVGPTGRYVAGATTGSFTVSVNFAAGGTLASARVTIVPCLASQQLVNGACTESALLTEGLRVTGGASALMGPAFTPAVPSPSDVIINGSAFSAKWLTTTAVSGTTTDVSLLTNLFNENGVVTSSLNVYVLLWITQTYAPPVNGQVIKNDIYLLQCGIGQRCTSTAGQVGITRDAGNRRVLFNNLTIPSTTVGGTATTLDGYLRY